MASLCRKPFARSIATPLTSDLYTTSKSSIGASGGQLREQHPAVDRESYLDSAQVLAVSPQEMTSKQPFLLATARTAAAMCGISLRTWRTWDAAGRIPQPVRIGRSTRWRVDELRAWVEAGCPRRAEWEARQV